MQAEYSAQDGCQLMVKLYLANFTSCDYICNQLNIHSLYPDLPLQYNKR